MAESRVASALVNKRAEIAGMITRTEQQLGQFRADVLRHGLFFLRRPDLSAPRAPK
jgi:hypothetical protein